MMVTEGGALYENRESVESDDPLSDGVYLSNVCVCGNF